MKLFNIDNFSGLREIDLFGLIYGYKKVISAGIPEIFLGKLKNTFLSYGLKYDVLDESYDYKHRDLTYLISKKTKYLQDLKSAYKSWQFDLIGKYLGYPQCCVDFYRKNYIKEKFPSTDFIGQIYRNSNNLSWKLNNILNFDGRIQEDIGHGGGFAPFINKGVFISLISHCPCSYDCKKSLEIANLNYKYSLLHKSLSFKYLHILKMPVLYIDDLRFIIFAGTSEGNSIRYRNILFCLGVTKLLPYLLTADTLTIDNNSVIVYKGIGRLKRFNYSKQILIFAFDKARLRQHEKEPAG